MFDYVFISSNIVIYTYVQAHALASLYLYTSSSSCSLVTLDQQVGVGYDASRLSTDLLVEWLKVQR